MVRSELLKKFCNQYPRLLRRDIEKILEIIFSEISEALSRDKNVEIRGFGTYKTIKRKARIGRNPRTGEQIQIAASQKVKFLPAKALKEMFNK